MKCSECHFENPADTLYCGKCGTQLISSDKIQISSTETLVTSRAELVTGITFAKRYQVIEELGKGGMGKVYKVLDKKINEKIALKLLKPEIASEEETIERFSNELRFARKISHKNVCRMYDLNEEEGTHYITMEYVPGEDLKSFIRRAGQLTVGKSVSVAKQVCEGLQEAHRLGVVHRDLKPQNIMIDREGNARIMDFGIARSLKGKGITDAGVIIGTPEYMSPEQVEGKEADHRSDIYSLGIILFEMVTGQVPFQGETPLSIVVKHKTELPPNPQDVNAHVPESLSQIILKCLEKDKNKRYQTVEDLLSVLEKIEKGIPTTDRIVLTERKAITDKIKKFGWKTLLIYGSMIVVLALIIIVGFTLFTGKGEVIDSVAVLPLENFSGDSEQEYFVDGMTEELISKLTQIGSLHVISRTSVMKYKGVRKSLPEIARELKVDAVVAGSVARSGERVRITAQLIDARTDRNIWSKSYERNLRDVLQLQTEIAQEIAREIKIELTPREQISLAGIHQINPEAYEAYLMGRHNWNKRTEKGITRSIEFFKRAIKLDPTYAKAYAGLADSYIVLGEWSIYPSKEVYPEAKEAVLKALEIDDNLAEAHNALAMVKRDYDWDWEGAEREFKRAIELNPNYPTAHQWYAESLTTMGMFDEALKHIIRAEELDPLSLIIKSIRGWVPYFKGQYDEALEYFQRALDLDSSFIPAHLYMAWSYEQKEMYEKAVQKLQKTIELSKGRLLYKANLGRVYAKMGKTKEAREILDYLMKEAEQKYVREFEIATLYAGLGETDLALDWLEKAYENRSYSLVYLKVNPLLNNLRSDPRFKELLKKAGFK